MARMEYIKIYNNNTIYCLKFKEFLLVNKITFKMVNLLRFFFKFTFICKNLKLSGILIKNYKAEYLFPLFDKDKTSFRFY